MPAMLIIIVVAIAAGGVFLLTVRCGHTARERKIKEFQRQLHKILTLSLFIHNFLFKT
jgi:hypothetical protein